MGSIDDLNYCAENPKPSAIVEEKVGSEGKAVRRGEAPKPSIPDMEETIRIVEGQVKFYRLRKNPTWVDGELTYIRNARQRLDVYEAQLSHEVSNADQYLSRLESQLSDLHRHIEARKEEIRAEKAAARAKSPSKPKELTTKQLGMIEKLLSAGIDRLIAEQMVRSI